MLSQAVQARVGWQARAKSQVLILEDDGCGGGVEKDFTARTPDDGEAERVLLVLELKLRGIAAAFHARGPLEDGLGDLVDFVLRILDLDVQALVCVMCQCL